MPQRSRTTDAGEDLTGADQRVLRHLREHREVRGVEFLATQLLHVHAVRLVHPVLARDLHHAGHHHGQGGQQEADACKQTDKQTDR